MLGKASKFHIVGCSGIPKWPARERCGGRALLKCVLAAREWCVFAPENKTCVLKYAPAERDDATSHLERIVSPRNLQLRAKPFQAGFCSNSDAPYINECDLGNSWQQECQSGAMVWGYTNPKTFRSRYKRLWVLHCQWFWIRYWFFC